MGSSHPPKEVGVGPLIVIAFEFLLRLVFYLRLQAFSNKSHGLINFSIFWLPIGLEMEGLLVTIFLGTELL